MAQKIYLLAFEQGFGGSMKLSEKLFWFARHNDVSAINSAA